MNKLVPIELLEEPTDALREVDESSQDFLDIVASMAAEGFWPSKPIEVTPGPPYVVNDGMTRLAAAKKASDAEDYSGAIAGANTIKDKAAAVADQLKKAMAKVGKK